ncbi:ribosome recycling factor [Candidatus Endomicrobiellum trichonymphae]|uniref:Ribosome-recycling factor n=1 Tax=Endomicrobium trichonymphae TaxID=1408204 RepID=RRF_ENDTX|nr:ribosome recycling factor [Candidatus Endomicrobium trichonymphae]B1H056.1 RecName: Full=Ribosome-recycling factor; Short=RRF; AltName: Full=Ribosome-releasing factor [Candidatus Endomicrobium trichonymphae]BAG13888.1 ribosome recycling factor [Candidatus Endomicrobium trichonymphae]
MHTQSFFSAAEEVMKRTIDRLKCELSSIRTGRVNSAAIETIKVESYGSIMPINQIASISVSDARTIEIRPWDVSQLSAIEKAILKADIGMSPANDGKLIRVSVPHLTQERRKEIAKSIGKMAEEFRVAIRNERRVLVENIKKLEKDKVITEDDKKKLEVEAQKVTDGYIKKIDDSIVVKEKEVMQV